MASLDLILRCLYVKILEYAEKLPESRLKTMIISFSLQNYRSFKERQVLNLHVEQGDELPQNIATPDNEKKIPVVRTAGIYGANASGKSNLLRGMQSALNLIFGSHKFDRNSDIPYYEPFQLDDKTSNAPVEFELDFVMDGLHFRYAFAYTNKEITFEELAFYPSNKEAILFSRKEGQNIDQIMLGGLLKGKRRKIAFLPNQLYLSVAANTEGGPQVLCDVWNAANRDVSINLNGVIQAWPCNLLLDSLEGQQKLLHFLQAVGTGIDALSVEKNDEQLLAAMYQSLPPADRMLILDANKYKVRCGHRDSKGEMVYFDLTNESMGSVRFLWMAGDIYYALKRGKVLVIDEMNTSLHPQLVEFLVELFNDPEINTKNAQLIFSTHDVTLMNPSYMRRDQLFFVDKNEEGISELYALDEFSEVRKNTPFAKWYMQHRFNATPKLDYSSIRDFMKEEADAQE